MSLEVISIVLSTLTLVVIAATAAAAIIQLRHMRASNQLSGLLEILEQWNQPNLQAAYSHLIRELPHKLVDEQYVQALRAPGSRDRASYPEFLIFDLWEQVGTYAKYGLIDDRIILDITSSQVLDAWNIAWPAIKILRERSGPSTYENFEYLAVLALRWNERTAGGAYPRGIPRMEALRKPNPPSETVSG